MLFAGLVHSMSVGVFDAGSTGTRLKLFEFDRSTVVFQSQVRSEDVSTCGEGKGLHQSSTAEVSCMVRQLLTQSNVQKSTVLGFYGTAGLRSVSTAKQDSVLNAVREAAKEYNMIEIKIITGNEEALYSLKGFEHLRPDERDFAIIDMGGKSVQIIQRSGKEIRLSSLQMGVLNSACAANGSSEGLLGPFRQSAGPRIELYEPVSKGDDHHYICSEKTSLEAWGFDCSLCAGVCNGTRAKNARSDLPKVSLQRTMDLGMQMIGLSFPDPSTERGLSSDVQGNKEILCIEEFFRARPVEKLRVASRIYLMSFFEEVVEEDGVTTLSRLLEDFREKCQRMLEGSCLKFYHSILFLEKIGVDPQSDLRLLNRIQGVDVSWSLGKAFELRNRMLSISHAGC